MKDRQHYVTLTMFTAPMLQSNCRGESDGNQMSLQKILLGGEQRTILTGPALRWALREAGAARDGEGTLFRHHNDPLTPSGYTYGPLRNPTINGGLKDLHKLGEKPGDFWDMRLFGLLSMEKEAVGNDLSKGQFKARSSILVGDGISITAFEGEHTFHQGQNPNPKKKKPAPGAKKPAIAPSPKEEDFEPEEEGAVAVGDSDDPSDCVGFIAPYSLERHFTRYQYRITVNMDDANLEDWLKVVDNAIKGLRVGGGHARHESETVPEAVLWRFYNSPGQSGMFRPDFTYPAGGRIDLTPFFELADQRGEDLYSAGMFTTSIPPVWAPIKLKDVVGVVREQSAAFLI